MLVLLQDMYRKDITDLSKYGDEIVIGFVGTETRSLLSLDLGDDLMYLLNRDRKVIYFDRIEAEKHEVYWLNFLKNYHDD